MSQHPLTYVSLLLAASVGAFSVRNGGFSAWGTDTCGYVSEGQLWHSGEIYRPQPLHLWATWTRATESASPLAYRAGPIRGTEVPIYPLGFPLLIAAAISLGGSLASYLVAPITSAVLVWCVFVLAEQLAGNLAGFIAAMLVASSPVVLINTVHPMSDVPAAALWAAAWVLALRGTVGAAVTAGLIASVAILVRPNLAPLALVVAAVVASAANVPAVSRSRWPAFVTFCAMAAIGPIIVLWSQVVLYGGPFTAGYGGAEVFFQMTHVATNLRVYPRLLATTHTVLPLAGLLLTIVALFNSRILTPRGRLLALSSGAMLLLNFALYLPYLPFEHWPFLRFLLPGLTALFILFASVLAYAVRLIWVRWRWVAVVVPLAGVFVVAKGLPMTKYAMQDWRPQTRVRLMGSYLRETLPANAAVFSFFHSCAVAHYTGRQVVRADVLDPQTFDNVVDDLTAHGYRPVLVIDRELEERQFRLLFASSRFAQLDWAPRAVFTTVSSILYLDIADRQRYQNGERWPIDVLR